MRRLAGMVVVIALASVGCIGSSGASTPAPSTGHGGFVQPFTHLTISYNVPTCPPGAKCLTAPGQSYYIVSRHLTCSPDGGDYEDPAAACRALADLVTKVNANPAVVCDCFAMHDPPKAIGIYKGERLTIPLDGCSLCGLQGVGDDLKLLLPSTG